MRLVTLNSWKGDGTYGRRLDAMAAGLSQLAPDIIALQEVLLAPSLGHDTAGHLATALGMTGVNLPLRRKQRDIQGQRADSWSGLAILSKHPILGSRAIALPMDDRDGERAALLARFDGFTLACLHLTHLADAGDLRIRQFQTIADGLDGPAILAGDFNTPADRLDLGRFTDCRGALGVTASPTVLGGGCVDHVLAFGPKPHHLHHALDPAAPCPASDHWAVVADLDLC
jgi:endonuclease/exonuclease/phosphatase family metal-dependent hydrolase